MPMLYPYDVSAPKRSTNLTVNVDLLSQAKALGINLSAVLEPALAAEVKRRKAENWLLQNQESIAAYNREIEASGTFSDHLRSF